MPFIKPYMGIDRRKEFTSQDAAIIAPLLSAVAIYIAIDHNFLSRPKPEQPAPTISVASQPEVINTTTEIKKEIFDAGAPSATQKFDYEHVKRVESLIQIGKTK